MKLNLHPKGIPKQEPLGADTPLKKGGVVVGMRKEGDKEKIYFVGDDCHLLCVGATRSGKSRCLVLESICWDSPENPSSAPTPKPNCSTTPLIS